jgi:hypothetical protein
MTRTAEELREAGRTEDEVRQYLAGVEAARRRFEELMAEPDEPPADPQPAPAIGTPAWEAQQTARKLLAQDEALQVLRAREQPQVAEFDADAAERRQWALTQALQDAPATRFDGRGGQAMMLNGTLVLAEMKNGLIDTVRPAVIESDVILPHQWDEHDKHWQVQRRQRENELLVRTYGLAQCVEAGLLTDAEAAELSLPAPAEPRGPKPPYRLERSVA